MNYHVDYVGDFASVTITASSGDPAEITLTNDTTTFPGRTLIPVGIEIVRCAVAIFVAFGAADTSASGEGKTNIGLTTKRSPLKEDASGDLPMAGRAAQGDSLYIQAQADSASAAGFGYAILYKFER